MRRLRYAWVRFLRDLRKTRTTHFQNDRHRYRRIE